MDKETKQTKCRICGQLGHNKRFHLEKSDSKQCIDCKQNLTLENFYYTPYQRPNGKVVEKWTSQCRNCNNERSKIYYRASVKNRLNALLSSVKSRCKKSGMVCDIDLPYLLDKYERQKGLCFYTETPMEIVGGNYSISLDRRNSEIGYTIDNVNLVCWIVNNMKVNLPEGEFIGLCTKIAKFT